VIVRIGVVALVLLTGAVMQTALFPLLPLGGFRPDLLLLVVVAMALRDGPLVGIRVGPAEVRHRPEIGGGPGIEHV